MEGTIADVSNIELHRMFTDFNKLRGIQLNKGKKEDEEPTIIIIINL
jgi:hypothetical protein